MLTPTTVGGLKQSLKCVMRWGLHHQCPVVSVTEKAYQHLIPDKRFSSHPKTAFLGLYLVPSVLVTEDLATVSSVVMKVGELYAVDLPNMSSVSGEVHNWYIKWKSEEKDHSLNLFPSTLSSTLTRISSFYLMSKPLCTHPVTSCTAERSFSGPKCIKTVLRSNMRNEHLSRLILLHMHQNIPIDIKEISDVCPDVIPGEFNFLTLLDSYLFIVLLHFFLLTLHMHINNESLRSNLVKVRLDSETSTAIQEQLILRENRNLGQSLYISIYKRHCNYSANQGRGINIYMAP